MRERDGDRAKRDSTTEKQIPNYQVQEKAPLAVAMALRVNKFFLFAWGCVAKKAVRVSVAIQM